MQQVAQSTNLNKCPHGFPAGTCPICNGGGGVSKDKNKPRVPGEMSYNECLAAWNKIQAAKEARIQERIDKIEAQNQKTLENRIMAGLDKIQKEIDVFLDKMPAPLKAPLKIALNTVINIISKVPVLIRTAQVILYNVTNFIFSVSEKMASIFGEIKNSINDFFKEKIKKSKEKLKTILTLFTQNFDEDDENKYKVEKILKIILEKIAPTKEKNEKEKEKEKEKEEKDENLLP